MIPKQLFFIWIGSDKPNYVDFSIKTFKEVNPNFKIIFIYEKDFNNIKNEDLKIILKEINNKNSIYYTIYNRPWIKKNFYYLKNQYANIVDCLKVYIVNKYGGIYLDCDTFPLKPFDNKLLNMEYFYGSTMYNIETPDFYFLGSNKNKLKIDFLNKNKLNKINLVPKYDIIFKTEQYKKFYNCKLEYLQDKNNPNYIYHFSKQEWLKK